MNRKEAIAELRRVDSLDMDPRLCEAYHMSIAALEECEARDASRVTENSKLHLSEGARVKGDPIEYAKAKFLEDISRSLAVIADCCLDEWQKNYTEEEKDGE